MNVKWLNSWSKGFCSFVFNCEYPRVSLIQLKKNIPGSLMSNIASKKIQLQMKLQLNLAFFYLHQEILNHFWTAGHFYAKSHNVDGSVVTFTHQLNLHRLLMISYRTVGHQGERQSDLIFSKITQNVDVYMATYRSNAYLRISARSCLFSAGAGGTTELNRRSRRVNDLRDFLLRCDGYVDGLYKIALA